MVIEKSKHLDEFEQRKYGIAGSLLSIGLIESPSDPISYIKEKGLIGEALEKDIEAKMEYLYTIYLKKNEKNKFNCFSKPL